MCISPCIDQDFHVKSLTVRNISKIDMDFFRSTNKEMVGLRGTRKLVIKNYA